MGKHSQNLRFRLIKWREISVVTLVVSALVALTTIELGVFAIFSYRSERQARWNFLRTQINLDADQLAAALALPVWDSDQAQIDWVIESIMRDGILLAVVLEEGDGLHVRTSWVRSNEGGIRKTEGMFTGRWQLREERLVQLPDGAVLARAELFASTGSLQQDLRHSLLVTIGRIIAVDVAISVGLYLLLCRWVFHPLRSVEVFARAVSSGGTAESFVARGRFFGELESLRQSIQTTLSQLESRLREKQRAQFALRHQADFDELVTRLMARFVGATPDEIDARVIESLQEVARFVGVESAVVVQVLNEGAAWGITHEWSMPDVGYRTERFRFMPMGSSEWIEKRIFADEPAVIASFREIPEDAIAIRERWVREGFKAMLTVPLRARGGHINGALGLLSFAHEKEWQPTDVARLRIMSEAIANTLERKRAEETVLQSREQLRALTGRLQSLREEERTRLSREIHDHLGQLLTALKLDLRGVERRVVALHDGEAKQAASTKLASAQKLADETLMSVQKIASELRPGILDRLGLAAAIQSEASAFEVRTGIHCECRVEHEPPSLPQEHSTAVFRIFQELLTNIARHSKATQTKVHLTFNRRQLRLLVRDNGTGIRATEVEDPTSLGILGIQERAALLGGQAVVQGKPGDGTTVTVAIPLAEVVHETSVNSR